MADQRFFPKPSFKKLGDIAHRVSGTLSNQSYNDVIIQDVASLDMAKSTDISFFDNIKYKDVFKVSKAGACIVSKEAALFAPSGMPLIITDNPYKTYAFVAQSFYPDTFPPAVISDKAFVHENAKIGKGCVIEAGAVIQENAIIGDGCWIESNVVIGQGVEIGQKCRIGACATVSHTIIGMGTRVYPGVRIGQDGFGFAIDPAGHVKVPQLGRVMIGDHVEIGANTCVDRGAGPDTVIGDGVWIDNLVQIGHNVKIGKGCVLVAMCGVAGSTVLEDYVVLAAQVGVAGHLRIGKGAKVGAQSGVMRDIPAGEEHLGSPSLPTKEYMRQVVTLKHLTKGYKSE